MVSPKAEKKAIRQQLADYYKIINPTNNMFWFDFDHPLNTERNRLIGVYSEYLAYERWFKNREQA